MFFLLFALFSLLSVIIRADIFVFETLHSSDKQFYSIQRRISDPCSI